ncbi:MAG: cytoplasmic protein [Myxococcota bacterium]|nr:cytoplasmic protein [Myxococcota bacterium]
MAVPSDVLGAHSHSSKHRGEIQRSDLCGCFYCRSTFLPAEIVEWIDETDGLGTTALCPRCGIDSVIGSASGYPLTSEFLSAMHDHWF